MKMLNTVIPFLAITKQTLQQQEPEREAEQGDLVLTCTWVFSYSTQVPPLPYTPIILKYWQLKRCPITLIFH